MCVVVVEAIFRGDVVNESNSFEVCAARKSHVLCESIMGWQIPMYCLSLIAFIIVFSFFYFLRNP